MRLVSAFTRSVAQSRACSPLFRYYSRNVDSQVQKLKTDEAYQQLTKENGSKSIVYFTASWCPPCKKISPIFDELSTKYDNISFAKLDVDELDATTSKAGVRSMPTFLSFHNGNWLRQLSFAGEDEALLRDYVQKLSDTE